MIDPRVAEIMADSPHLGFTWNDALKSLDLAKMNARAGGKWSRGRAGTQEKETRK